MKVGKAPTLRKAHDAQDGGDGPLARCQDRADHQELNIRKDARREERCKGEQKGYHVGGQEEHRDDLSLARNDVI